MCLLTGIVCIHVVQCSETRVDNRGVGGEGREGGR